MRSRTPTRAGLPVASFPRSLLAALALLVLGAVGAVPLARLLSTPVASAAPPVSPLTGASVGTSQAHPVDAERISPACRAPEARQFDFWTGEWDVRVFNRSRQDGQMYETNRAVMRGYPILDGCAFIEHWEGPPTYGYSIRAWDPDEEKWVLVLSWPAPDNAFFWSLEGEFAHGRGEFFFEQEQEDGTVLNRYTFSDISEGSLRWESAVSRDDGLSWMTTSRFEFTRRDAHTRRGLTVGPTPRGGDGSKCSQTEARWFDFLSGQWVGTVDPQMPAPAPDSSPPIQRNPILGADVLLTADPILDGCAVQEFVEVLGADIGDRTADARGWPSFKRYAVRAWVPGRGEWVEYSIDNRDPTFRTSSGPAGAAAATLTESEEDEQGTLRRRRWLDVTDDAFRLVLQRSDDGGATWSEVHTIHFRRRG